MSESLLQQLTVHEGKRLGYLMYKFAAPGNRGVPDLIAINKLGRVYFMELKNPNGKGKLSRLQEHIHEQFEANNVTVHVFDNLELIRGFLKKHA